MVVVPLKRQALSHRSLRSLIAHCKKTASSGTLTRHICLLFVQVNPAKTDAATIAHNVSIVTQLAFDVLTNVLSSAKKFPLYVCSA